MGNHLSPENKGNELLVPMTSSMYVAGVLDESLDKVLVDVGTGYFVEKTVSEASKYFSRKIEFITKQMEKIQPSLLEKQGIRGAVMEAYAAKASAQMSAQKQGAVAVK